MPRSRLALALVCLVSPALSNAAAPPPTKEANATECKLPEKRIVMKADAKSREAAHKGFTYLAKSSIQWTRQHNCFGCHVQAVTMEALTAARHYQYDVNPKDLEAMMAALKMGVTAGGRTTGVAFEGAAWARYDKFIDGRQTDELLKYAAELVKLQAANGSIPDDDARLPITGGTMQTTFQAAQTWRQAHARTADDKWLTPLRRAERFLTATADKWKSADGVYLQDIDFALLGLASAGVTRAEPASERLQKLLLSRQNEDGGWGLDPKKSDAFATGQALYTLRMAGYSDADPVIGRGIAYLLTKQSEDGAWRTAKSGQNGSEKGETMWAVLGLVTVDVASVAVKGLIDGQHVQDTMTIDAEATDNQSGGIAELAFFVDDVRIKTECGPKLSVSWNTTKLTEGKHVVDVVATTAQGKQSRRRLDVYAGNIFMTSVGAVFDERAQQTHISLRSIADAKAGGAIDLEIWSLTEKDEKPKDKVFTSTTKPEPGAMQLSWNGKGADGKALPRGRYVAKVVFKDAKGEAKQSESTVFLHDSDDVARNQFGEVEGSLGLAKLGISSANTLVELVDDSGNVVQQVRSTEQGNYRFKNVKPGSYKVRAQKEGYRQLESPVEAAPSAAKPAAKADFSW